MDTAQEMELFGWVMLVFTPTIIGLGWLLNREARRTQRAYEAALDYIEVLERKIRKEQGRDRV